MHELGLCRNILQLVEEHAESEGYMRVRRICLDIGILAAIEPEAMHFGFAVASRGTMAEGAVLEIHTVAAVACCAACGGRAEIGSMDAVCPHCGSARLQIDGGGDMRIRELEVE